MEGDAESPWMSEDGEEHDDGKYDNRLRTVRACDACHRSKAKCGGDGVHPCPSCVRKGAECTYSAAKKRGPKTGAVRALQDEISLLRAQVAVLTAALDSKPTVVTEEASSDPIAASMLLGLAGSKRPRGRDDTATARSGRPRLDGSAGQRTGVDAQSFLSTTRIAPLDMEVRFLRTYMLFSNTVLPMVCRESLYYAAMRLGALDTLLAVCKAEAVVCDHARGDCASNYFVPLTMEVPAHTAAATRTRRRTAQSVRLDSFDITGMPMTEDMHAHAQTAGSDAEDANQGVAAAEYQALERAHLARLPAALQEPQANTKPLQAAAAALVLAVLGIGARMDMQPERADRYMARSRTMLAHSFDQPCLESVSALMLHAYYSCGVAESGDMLRAKCYTSLANEMADGLEMTAAAIKRRATTNSFGTDRPGTTTTSPPQPHGHTAPAATARAPAAVLQGDAYKGYPYVESGIPLDVLLSVRFMAQLTTAYRALNQDMQGEEWESPRGRISRTLAYVTGRTRRRNFTTSDASSVAPRLLAQLDDAASIAETMPIAGPMTFAMLACVHVSRAVIYHGLGNADQARHWVDKAFECMSDSLRVLVNYFIMSIFVQLIPVCIAYGQYERVRLLQGYISELGRMWPVGKILLAKAKRRVVYATSKLPDAERMTAMEMCGVSDVDFQAIIAATNAPVPPTHPTRWPLVPPNTHDLTESAAAKAAASMTGMSPTPVPNAATRESSAASSLTARIAEGPSMMADTPNAARTASTSSLLPPILLRSGTAPPAADALFTPPQQLEAEMSHLSARISGLDSAMNAGLAFDFIEQDPLDIWTLLATSQAPGPSAQDGIPSPTRMASLFGDPITRSSSIAAPAALSGPASARLPTPLLSGPAGPPGLHMPDMPLVPEAFGDAFLPEPFPASSLAAGPGSSVMMGRGGLPRPGRTPTPQAAQPAVSPAVHTPRGAVPTGSAAPRSSASPSVRLHGSS